MSIALSHSRFRHSASSVLFRWQSLALILLGMFYCIASASGAGKIVYRLSAFDRIKITVYGEKDLSTEQLITDNGMVFMPLVGPVKVGGQTISGAAQMITQALISQEYLRKPVVTISIESFSPKVVTVLGEVNKPGSIEVPPGQNGLPIEIAIAQAGGFTGTAKTTDVMITRAGTAQKKGHSSVVNVEKILRSKNGRGNSGNRVVVHPDDVVFVPRRVF